MEILLEPTSKKLMVERFYTTAGNPVKEILLKLNLPDHRSILTDSKLTSVIMFSLLLIISLHLLSGRHVCSSYKALFNEQCFCYTILSIVVNLCSYGSAAVRGENDMQEQLDRVVELWKMGADVRFDFGEIVICCVDCIWERECFCGGVENKIRVKEALESADATKVAELASLTAQTAKLTQDLSELCFSCDELSVKASSLEAKRDRLISQVSLLEGTCFELCDKVSGYWLFKEKIKVVQDEKVKVLSDKVPGLDAELMEMALHLDEEFYPCFLTTIAGRRWILGCAIGRAIDNGMQDGLAAGINHGKSGRGRVDVTAYNPSVEANYVFVVSILCDVDFPLLAQLDSQKDASIADIMGLLHLEGPSTEVPKTNQLQPSPEQLMLPIHRDVASQRLSISDAMVPLIEPLSAEYLVGEANTSGVLVVFAATTALSTTFVEASSDTSFSHKIVFKEETLETSPENLAT
nr:hypothetical protein [Tanacetum cinerariifolium]